jgi:hypothetical protein
MIVALSVYASHRHPIADKSSLDCYFIGRLILLVVEIHDAEGATAKLLPMDIFFIVVE